MADETKKDEKPARDEYLKGLAAEASKGEDTPTEMPEVGDSAGDIEFDLSTIEDEDVRGSVKDVLDRAKASRKNARDLATFGIQQAVHSKALELAIELEVPGQVRDIESLLRGVKTPKELELRVREVRLDLLNESVPGKKTNRDKSRTDEDGKDEGKERVFDEGRGRGTNVNRELAKKINAIDPSDPESQKQLDELYDDVLKAQQRHSARK